MDVWPLARSGRLRRPRTVRGRDLIAVGALGLWIGWPRTVNAAADTANGTPAIVWEPWSNEAVARLRGEGRTVYADFTARWCATCQTNKKLVFTSDEVKRYFAASNIATLRADWTNKDPRITAELAAYNRSAVPFNLIWAPGRDEPIILPERLLVIGYPSSAASPTGRLVSRQATDITATGRE